MPRRPWPAAFGRATVRLRKAVRRYENVSRQHNMTLSRAAVVFVDENGRIQVYGNRLLCESVRRSSVLSNTLDMLNSRQHLDSVRVKEGSTNTYNCIVHTRTVYTTWLM